MMKKGKDETKGTHCGSGDCHCKDEAGKEEESSKQVTLSQQDYDALLAKLAELEALREQWIRSAADFDNAKKRLARDREEFLKFGQENMIRNLLPVLDNFHRALDHAGDEKNENNLKSLVTGVQMIFKQMQDLLQSQGLKKLETVGKKFDPHLHEAIGYVHDEGEEDAIVGEVEAGYQLHDRLLRPAKVRVRMVPSSGKVDEALPDEKQDEIT
jgi:molecular chaperone GrpE